jgi:hypothetical protein
METPAAILRCLYTERDMTYWPRVREWLRNFGKIGWTGIALSIIYFAVLHWMIKGRWGALRGQDLNNIGDFLAGAFGPLAILWLVLGFFQQGIELRQNSEALHLQAKELQNSVTQQADLAATAKAQFDLDKAALEHRIQELKDEEALRRRMLDPRLDISGTCAVIGLPAQGKSFPKYVVDVRNRGNDCSDLHLSLSIGQEQRYEELRQHDVWKVIFDQPLEPPDWPIHAQLSYLTTDREEGCISYVVHMNDGALTFTEYSRNN